MDIQADWRYATFLNAATRHGVWRKMLGVSKWVAVLVRGLRVGNYGERTAGQSVVTGDQKTLNRRHL